VSPRLSIPALADDVVALRPWRDTDLRRLVAMCRDPEVARWTRVPDNYTREDALTFLALVDVERRSGRAAHLAITLSEDETIAGSASLQHVDWGARAGEIGYYLAPECRGQGLATRALDLLAGHALGELGLGEIHLHAATANVASQRVAERAGFARLGVAAQPLVLKGRRIEVVRFLRRS
jgi:RimJ/RimL family protein N-acetyltransferase